MIGPQKYGPMYFKRILKFFVMFEMYFYEMLFEVIGNFLCSTAHLSSSEIIVHLFTLNTLNDI